MSGYPGLEIIDVDAHVEECEETFSDQFFDEKFADKRPHIVKESDTPKWVIGEQRHSRTTGRGPYTIGPFSYQGKRARTSYGLTGDGVASAEMRRPDLRVKEMRTENIVRSVIFPTLFLKWPLTKDVELGVAICQSYNNWMSYRCGQQEGLEWASVVPLTNDTVDMAVTEMVRANDLGAAGVMILGLVEENMLHEAQFEPFFAAAAKHNIPINVHVGFPSEGMGNVCDSIDYHFLGPFTMTVQLAFLSIIMCGILDKFPALRVSFLEAGCDWVPFMLARMEDRFQSQKRRGRKFEGSERSPYETVHSGNVFIHTEITDIVTSTVIDMVGEDVLVFASDIPHAHRHLDAGKAFYEREDIGIERARKILWDNPKRLFNFK